MITTELLELGSRPIRPDAPAGGAGRDEREFEVLQLEIRKLELPERPAVNWDAAISASTTLLGEKSKDLLVASYLCVALLERDGFAGFAAGLTILRDLLTNFWDRLYPEVKRMRGRLAAIEWLAERGSQAVNGKPRGRASAEVVAQCIERVGQIDETVGVRMDAPPLLGDLRRALEEHAASVQPAAVPPAEMPGEQVAAASTGAGPPAFEAVASVEELDRAFEEIARVAELAASFLRANQPADPLGYRLLRMIYWRNLREVPPNEGGATLLPDYDPALFEQIEQQIAAGDCAPALEQIEGTLSSAPLWFDLTRCAVAALEAQGEAYAAAAEGVVFELATLLRRVPDLVGLKTSGGIPFANDATRKWIAERVLVGASDAGSAVEPPAALGARVRGGEGFAEAVKEARKLARSKKLGEALAVLEKGAQAARRLDDRVAWKLEVARLCTGAGHHELALSQLEALDEELRRSSIENWDPALCVEVLKDLIACRRKAAAAMEVPPTELLQSRDLMGRICKLDVLAALELDGRK